MNSALISVIIPIYNRAHLIVETLNTIISQTYVHWECIIVDDGSTDNTLQILDDFKNKDGRFNIYKRPDDKLKGANACRNFGLKKSKGDYVLFLDSDDLLKATCLQKRLNIFNENDNLDFVIANTAYYQNNEFQNRPICEFPEHTVTETYLNSFLRYELPWTSTMSALWKRETIANIKFDENLMRLQDVDFHIRVLLQKDLICYRLSKIDNYYRITPDKAKDKNHQRIVVDGATSFVKKYLDNNILNGDNLKNFKALVIFFSINYFYPNQKEYRFKLIELESSVNKSKLFSRKEIFILKIYKFITNYRLASIKNIGINRLVKLLKKQLKYRI